MNRQDLLSLLPDCVLGEIVTRLPTRDAVHLQLVSSRYRNAWRASPLNLDVDYRDAVRVLVYLRCHPGPTRRLRLERLSTSYYGDFDHWLLFSPALAGLQALELQLQTLDVSRRPLPPPALRFAATLVVLKIGSFTFPSPPAAKKPLWFPRLELLSFRRVDISEAALHGLLAGCPALQTLVLDECVGFARVRITSASIRSVAVSSSSNLDHATVTRPWQIIIEDAPRLQTVVPFRHRSNNHSDDDESGGGSSCRRSLDLRIVSAPNLRVLGSLSTKTVRKLELGATVFKVIDRIVKHVHGNSASHEKRSEVRAICLATTMPSVKVLALEDVDRMHINDFLRCFPRLERLYLKGSQGIFRSEGTYGVKLNPIECFELYLRRIVFNGYKGDTSDVKLVKFFLTKARVLESISFRFSRSNNNVCSEEEWIADQRFRMRLKNRASESAKLSFAHDEGYRDDDVYCCGEYASDVTDHIHYY